MPPILALAATFAFVLFLFVLEAQRKEHTSPALWIPVAWMAVTASRFPSQWLNPYGSSSSFSTEGSPLDAVYFMLLILAGLGVLLKRRVTLASFISQNGWLFAFLLFGFIAIAWSDFHFVALKRWVKALGHPVMALVIMSDPDPVKAFRVVMKRLAFLLLPLSVALIKYFPDIGRTFDPYYGTPANTGVGLTKNDLGYICMLFGIFFVWEFFVGRKRQEEHRQRDGVIAVIFLAMTLWLLTGAGSATAYSTLALGLIAMYFSGRRIVYRHLFGMLIAAVLLFIASEYTFDIYSRALDLLGRDATLTDRTRLWTDVIELQDSPVIGVGFESFWLGERAVILAEEWWWHPNQAHNGYLETYLNLGFVGLFLLLAVIVSTFRNIKQQLPVDLGVARLRLAYLVAILAFNYTEAAFKGVHVVLTIFFIIAIRYSQARATATTETPRVKTAKRASNVPRHAMRTGGTR